MDSGIASLPKTREQWRKALDDLPDNPEKIPAFFFGHGSPMLVFPESETAISPILKHAGSKGPLANFLRDFGPALLAKYKPKAIVVFSAHWDTLDERLVTDYGEENPLFYDYYGFQPELYQLKFKSRGDSAVSQRVVELFKESGLSARTSSKLEPRGQDGLGKNVPGLDHGVFVPFSLMFGEDFTDIPVIEISLDGSLDPLKNWAVGQAVSKLRQERILVLSGGLTIHNLRDFSCFAEDTAKPIYFDFDKAILEAIMLPDAVKRKTAMVDLVNHVGFKVAHPRADHFVPLYVAAGAGEGDDVRIISAIYGSPTIAFGV
ncbi:uncharacterized protein PHACADRAFT_256379 [Phanerochaete carnosa HHB-10118-sp]|uniref:Extradiol ring-cleavage dioxygenase class III enzyme subunit B domain-containing protein n=1 Tax=Phanerochaete carnosa (strain HHB-10118-sp) TaxID=650164 RepID=K5W8U6_PHACS|nr:uncharacterized protein PHACADRAFT_256379 [Phanerochaete carnosa HHB-10118-sp]EKM55630.1 hypothetical protein PHACADRAFT_256379 [Phanerochaete carnosa HHB-10118-sp]